MTGGRATSEADESVVTSTLLADLPVTLAGLTRTNIRIEPVGPGMWDAEITYSLIVQSSSSQSGQPTFSFDTGGGTQHITQSLGMISSQAPGDFFGFSFAGAGDVNGDGFDDLIVGAPLNDAGGAGRCRNDVVSIHAPVKGRPREQSTGDVTVMFQSTPL